MIIINRIATVTGMNSKLDIKGIMSDSNKIPIQKLMMFIRSNSLTIILMVVFSILRSGYSYSGLFFE